MTKDSSIAEGAAKCLTCGGSGWLGGPSFYNPGEGGESCPDCAAPPSAPIPMSDERAVLVERLTFLTANDPHASVIAKQTFLRAAALLAGQQAVAVPQWPTEEWKNGAWQAIWRLVNNRWRKGVDPQPYINEVETRLSAAIAPPAASPSTEELK